MPRLRSAPIAVLALLATAGVVAAASLPDAAAKGLAIARQHAGHPVPVVPEARPDAVTTNVDAVDEETHEADAAERDAPDAAAHGAAVSAVATADDATPDTNHGADVSAVARDNHGQAIAAEHKPSGAGKPETVGKPASVGAPEGAGTPDDPGKPADPARP